jgi:hypothetical protein
MQLGSARLTGRAELARARKAGKTTLLSATDNQSHLMALIKEFKEDGRGE